MNFKLVLIERGEARELQRTMTHLPQPSTVIEDEGRSLRAVAVEVEGHGGWIYVADAKNVNV